MKSVKRGVRNSLRPPENVATITIHPMYTPYAPYRPPYIRARHGGTKNKRQRTTKKETREKTKKKE